MSQTIMYVPLYNYRIKLLQSQNGFSLFTDDLCIFNTKNYKLLIWFADGVGSYNEHFWEIITVFGRLVESNI